MSIIRRHWKWAAGITVVLAVIVSVVSFNTFAATANARTTGELEAAASDLEAAASDLEATVASLESENQALLDRLTTLESVVSADDESVDVVGGLQSDVATLESDVGRISQALRLAGDQMAQLEDEVVVNSTKIDGAYTLADDAISVNADVYNQAVGEMNAAVDQLVTYVEDVRSCVNWNLDELEKRWTNAEGGYAFGRGKHYLRSC